MARIVTQSWAQPWDLIQGQMDRTETQTGQENSWHSFVKTFSASIKIPLPKI